jgi:hypothetical protein
MASQTSDQPTSSADRVSFEVESMACDDQGRLLVNGRWFGVRGRRFVRPTLTLTVNPDGSEQRALADLEHKPWAAEDGEPWIAAFPLEIELKEAKRMELSVAPDIAVDLPSTRTRKRSGVQSQATQARAPRVRSDRVPARPSAADQSIELERLRTRLAAADRDAKREREKRAEADRALEDERSDARRLRSEIARLRAELDIAATARGELAAAAAELDTTRAQARDSGTRLQSTARALDQERAEADRLRMRLTAAEATVERLTRSNEAERKRAEEETVAVADRLNIATRVFESIGSDAPVSRASHPGPAARREAPPSHRTNPHSDAHHVRGDRPLNPALRPRANWPLRVMALIVLLGVIAAIILVIRSTVA